MVHMGNQRPSPEHVAANFCMSPPAHLRSPSNPQASLLRPPVPETPCASDPLRTAPDLLHVPLRLPLLPPPVHSRSTSSKLTRTQREASRGPRRVPARLPCAVSCSPSGVEKSAWLPPMGGGTALACQLHVRAGGPAGLARAPSRAPPKLCRG